MKYSMLAAAILAFLAAGPVGAQNWGFECMGDAQKFCPGIMPGDPRLLECLKEHEAELSDPCKAKGEELKKELSSLDQVCAGDLQKFCAAAGPAPADRIRCLKTNKAQLSADCKAKLETGEKKLNLSSPTQRKKIAKKNPCASDIKEFCEGIGRAGISACLKENADALSGVCKAHLARIRAQARKRAKALKAQRAAEKAERERDAQAQDGQLEN